MRKQSLFNCRQLALMALLSLLSINAWAGSERATEGPDVTVFALSDTSNYGAVGGIRGYAVGTTSCNIGTQPLNWCDQNGGCGLSNGKATTNHDHPVISQNMYRLKNDRFEQIGASWLKHGFVSTNSNSVNAPGGSCLTGVCAQPPLGGNQLGVGCTDPYVSSLNGSRPLGRKSEVNATTGAYPFPYSANGNTAAVWNERLAVAESDLSAAANPGARYFVEGHYVAPDDASSGNGLNNASYREVNIGAAPNLNLSFSGLTQREKSAIEVWAVIDPTVEMFNVDVPGSPVQRFQVARKVTETTPGEVWHYEYTVHNMNADRSADRLTVNFHEATTFSNIGFHDVDAHSGEPYDTTDWNATTDADTVQWQAPAFAQVENGNAIRWSTSYTFWFDANRGPGQIADNQLGLFVVGAPSQLIFGENDIPAMFEDGYEDPN